jgi:methylamine utilization protein MauE
MPDPAVRIIAALLAATFAWAALAKVLRWSRWRTALTGYELPPALRVVAAAAVPLAEAGVASLLLAGLTRSGAAATVALLASFSGALLYARERRGDRLPCGCFGRATDRDYRVLLLRNAALGLLAAALLAAGRDVSPARGWSAPSGDELLPAVLVAAGVVLVAWTLWQVATSFGGRARR